MVVVLLAGIGLCFGSFVNALVWRMHKNGVGLESKKKISKKYSITRGRSMCIHCRHELGWYDLLPVVSWLLLSGKCRYCKKTISVQYPVVEVVVALLFVISYLWWPYELVDSVSLVSLVFWLAIVVCGAAMALYDLKWMILPSRLIYAQGVFAVSLALLISYSTDSLGIVASAAIGSLAYGGFFWLMYILSSGKWIGGGDVRLSFVLGIFLGWKLAFVSLAAASYMGTILFLILVFMGKYHKKMRIPFGPLLLMGAFIAMLWGEQIIRWYSCLTGCSY